MSIHTPTHSLILKLKPGGVETLDVCFEEAAQFLTTLNITIRTGLASVSKTGSYLPTEFQMGRRCSILVSKDSPTTVTWLLLKHKGNRRETKEESQGMGRQGTRTQAAKAVWFPGESKVTVLPSFPSSSSWDQDPGCLVAWDLLVSGTLQHTTWL